MKRLLKRSLITAGFAIAAISGPVATSVAADEVAERRMARCMPHAQMVDQLKTVFGEQPTAMGLTAEGRRVFEVFVSNQGSWTLVVTHTNGSACVASSGNNWTDIPTMDLAEKAT